MRNRSSSSAGPGESIWASATQGCVGYSEQTGIIVRSRLDRVLDSSNSHPNRPRPVILLCAPAGTGKSVLLDQWAKRSSTHFGHECAWLRITDHDNNVSVFCSSLRRAFDPVARLSKMPPPLNLQALDRFIDELTSSLEIHEEKSTLIIDDAHKIYDPIVIGVIDRLLETAPANLSLVFAARHEPPQSWTSLALQGRLTRLGTLDLAFDTAEIQLIFEQTEVFLDDAMLSIVVDRTQGWGALVRFAAMYLSQRHDMTQAVAEFANTPRPVSDFLVGEILSTLNPDTYSFLLCTAIPTRFTLDLAMTITGDAAPAQLAELERLNIPLTRLDTDGHHTWFSYHPMLREHLRAEFCRHDAEGVRRAHTEAAQWFETHGYYLLALEHEVEIADDARILAFLGRRGFGMILDGMGSELISVLSGMPAAVAEDDRTRLLHAAAAVAAHDFSAGAAFLDLLQGTTWSSVWERSLFLALQLETARRVLAPSHDNLLDTILRHSVSDVPDVAAYVHLQIGASQSLRYAFAQSALHLEKAIALAQLGNRHRLALECMTNLAFTCGLAADIEEMVNKSDCALIYADEHGLASHQLREQADSVATLARYLRASSPLDTILDDPSQAHSAGNSTGIPARGWRASVIFALHDIELSQGNRRPATFAMRDAMSHLIEAGDHPTESLALLPVVVHACLNIGAPDWASRIVHDAAEKFGETADVRLGSAAISLATGKITEARAEIDILSIPSTHFTLAGSVYVTALAACVHAHQGDLKRARVALETSLARARKGAVLRPFLDLKGDIRPLLGSLSGHFGDNNHFAESLRRQLDADTMQPRLILTPAEMKTLRELASGDTTEDIAAALWVSVNTVKTHLRGIYRKLDVTNRREALRAARTVGLL